MNSKRKNYDTLIEKQVEDILLILDLAFLEQKRFGRWSVDFYLGRKYCIDVHGEWAHSKRKIIERGKRKKPILKHTLLIIWSLKKKNYDSRKK